MLLSHIFCSLLFRCSLGCRDATPLRTSTLSQCNSFIEAVVLCLLALGPEREACVRL